MPRIAVVCTALLMAGLSRAQTYTLRLQLPKGRSERVSTLQEMHMAMTTPEKPQGMKMDMRQTSGLTWRVIESSKDRATAKLTYGRFKTTISEDGGPAEEMGDEGLRGKNLILEFVDGRIKRVKGLEQLVEDPDVAAMSAFTSQSDFTRMWGFYFGGTLPKRPVSLGDTWEDQWALSVGPMAMEFKLTFRLLEVEAKNGRKVARIWMSGVGTLDMSQILPGTDAGANSMGLTGSSYFDLARGSMISQTLNLWMKMRVAIPGNSGQDVSFSVKLKGLTRATAIH